MFELIVILSLVILLLARLNFDALKRLKAHKHDTRTIELLQQAKEELWDEKFILKREIMVMSIRLQEHRNEIMRQQKINYKLIAQYNHIRNSVIDVPLKHGRFFDIHIEKENLLLSFSEN